VSFKSILKPDQSTLVGLAAIGSVFAVYQLNVGNVSQAAATEANHPVLESSRKKAGYTALALVSSLFLITRDANVAILGGGTIIFMELSYRHGIMSHPESGKLVNPAPATAYEPAENVVPIFNQGATG
jgi:hypothetical protein